MARGGAESGNVGTLSGRVVLRLVDFVARRGHDPEALCGSVGLRLGALKDENLGLHLAQTSAILCAILVVAIDRRAFRKPVPIGPEPS